MSIVSNLTLMRDKLSPEDYKSMESFADRLNELNDMNSYAYHHILLVANTTQVTEALFASNDIDSFMYDTSDQRFDVRGMPGKQGGYMILINGMVDSDYQIHTVEWESILDINASISNPHAMFVEGTMHIEESRGCRFLNMLKIVTEMLDCGPDSLMFVLKTVFVGHTPTGIRQVINVKPFNFMMYDITGEFNSSGSRYELSFVGSNNGISRLPQVGRVNQLNIKGNTVKDAITTLQTELNRQADTTRDHLSQQLASDKQLTVEQPAVAQAPAATGSSYAPGQQIQAAAPTQTTSTGGAPGMSSAGTPLLGRRIRYDISVDPSFESFPLDNVSNRLKQEGGEVVLNGQDGVDIDTIITDIMNSSTKTSAMVNEQVSDKGLKTIFKIETTVTSDLSEYVIHYRVKKCTMPITVEDNRDGKGTNIEPDLSNRPVIEFDYSFTGNNLDILEYNMKMAMGIAYFQSLGTVNNLPNTYDGGSGQTQIVANANTGVASSKEKRMPGLSVFPPQKTVNDPSAHNKVNAGAVAQQNILMARMAALESLEARVTIRGIPALLDGFISSEEEILTYTKPALKESTPLIKINVRMPTTNDHYYDDGTISATESFWYQGVFRIISIKNVFDGGRFTQELELLPLLNDILVDAVRLSGDTLEQQTKRQVDTNGGGEGDGSRTDQTRRRSAKEQGYTAPPGTAVDVNSITVDMMQYVYPNCPRKQIELMLPPWKAMCVKYNITTPERIAMFLGASGVETGEWTAFIEKDSGQRYEGKVKNLGNTQPGDGPKYRGRGMFQLTGRWSYTAAAKVLGADIVNNPDLVSTDPRLICESAGWFVKTARCVGGGGMNDAADAKNFKKYTGRIYGSETAIPQYEQRYTFYMRALQLFQPNNKPGTVEPKPGNPYTPPVVPDGNIPDWMKIANQELKAGISEKRTPERVREYHANGTGQPAPASTAWCAGFANWCLKQSGHKGTSSAMARSFEKTEKYGARAVGKTNLPYGTIAVFWRNSMASGQGHVGFVTQDSGDKLQILGGNQGSSNVATGGQVKVSTWSKDKMTTGVWPG